MGKREETEIEEVERTVSFVAEQLGLNASSPTYSLNDLRQSTRSLYFFTWKLIELFYMILKIPYNSNSYDLVNNYDVNYGL